MPDTPSDGGGQSKFTITNAHLAVLITVLGILGFVGNALHGYVDAEVSEGKMHQTVVDHSDALRQLRSDIDTLQKSHASQKESLTWLEGKLDAEKGRAYEADQQQSRLLDMLRQLIAGSQPAKQP